MADQKLTINIGSSWNGAGMQKAMGAVNTLSRSAGKAARAVNGLGSAFGSLGGEAGKAVNAIAGFAGAFATGGVWGFAIAGLTTAIQLFKDSFAMMDEMKKKAEEQAKAWEKAEKAAEKWIEQLNQKDFDEVISNTEKYVAELNKVAAAQNKVNAAQAKFNAASGALKIAEMKANGASNADIAAEESRMSATAQADNVKLKSEALKLAKTVELNVKAGLKAATWSKTGKMLTDDELKNDPKMKEATAAREAAELDYSTALQQQKKAVIDAKENEKRAEEQDVAAIEANNNEMWAAINVQKERNDKMRDEARTETKLKEAVDKDASLREELAAATENLKNAENEYAFALRNAANAANNANWQGWAGSNGVPADQIAGNGINGQNRYGARNNATLNDAGYNSRVEEGMARNARSQGFGLSPKEQREYDDLAWKMAKGTISGKDKQRLSELAAKDPEAKRRKAEQAADKAAKELKAAQEKKDKAEQQMQTNVADIKRMMEKLGLK